MQKGAVTGPDVEVVGMIVTNMARFPFLAVEEPLHGECEFQ